MKIFLNPGHAPNGIPDPGAVNENTGLRECDVARAVANLVEEYLIAAGVEVLGNLQHDDLGTIVSTANETGADLFVSIHCNAAYSEQAQGTETFYFYTSREGQKLAQAIQLQIVDSLGTVDRGIKPAQPGRNGLYVLNNTSAISVLVELAFISNDQDCELLAVRQDEFARAIARGITDYDNMR